MVVRGGCVVRELCVSPTSHRACPVRGGRTRSLPHRDEDSRGESASPLLAAAAAHNSKKDNMPASGYIVSRDNFSRRTRGQFTFGGFKFLRGT